MKLETDRLILRPFEARDLPHVQCCAVRREFYRYIPIPEQTPATVAAYLEDQIEQSDRGPSNRWTWALEAKDMGLVIGSVRMDVRDEANRQGDVGFGLDSDFQGRGLMTEALKAVLRVGFEEFNMHRIWATADVDNQPSWRLMERVGMRREGHLRHHIWLRDRWRDSYLYAILAPG